MIRTCDFCDRDALKIELEGRADECRQLRQAIEDMKRHTLYQSAEALRAELDALRALLVRGIAFAANCDADPEQPEGFREKARAWREEVNTMQERT